MQKNPPLSREAGHLVRQQMERYSEDRRFRKRCFWLAASTRIIYHTTASSFTEIGPHDVFIHCQKPIAIYGKGSEGVGVWMPTITLCHAGLPESSLEPVVTSRRMDRRSNIMDMFETGKVVKVCAPMVRYSKLAFRCLVRKYDCDVCFTPMIVAADFMRSVKARDSEFTTNRADRPLIVQFAAKDAQTLVDAACVVAPFSDGVDLNCGCPQRWAMSEGYGACLINKPDLVKDMVRQVRNQIEDPSYAVSIKIRIHKDLRKTVDMCQKAEAAGVSWITVHGRTADERHQPVHYDAIKTIKDSLAIPVIANGDIKSSRDVESIHQLTGVNGVMSARGLLANPAMYAGYEETPLECIWDWVDIALEHGTPFTCFHHHLIYMLERISSQPERRIFNTLSSTSAVIDYLSNTYGSV